MRTRLALTALAAVIGFASPASADEKSELVVYTYDSFIQDWSPGPVIKERFEAVCDCTLTFVGADSSIGTLRKLQLEGTESDADVLLGLDTNIMENARDTGLFATHGADTSGIQLPVDWIDDTFIPFDFGYFAFVYDKRKVENPPASLAELASMPDDFKVVIQDPRSSTPGLGFVLWVDTVKGEGAADYWRDLQPNILTVTKGWSEAYGLFLEGEADMVLSYTTSPAYHLIAEEDPNFASAAFSDGHQIQIEVAAKVANSDQPDLARDFLQFMLDEGFQSTIPTQHWMYPATGIDLPDGYETLHVPEKAILQDPATVEETRKAAIDVWLEALDQ
ncbi:MAG: thiamine ABC transporter substrate binding subunit [Pseudomonadota bacterium]